LTHPGSPFWVPSPALQAHLNRTATGNPRYDWLSFVRAEHLPPRVPRTLVLGCGNGFLERALSRHSGIEEILATDPDSVAVESAANAARREGRSTIAYRRLDVETESLPGDGWNLILANDLLHHVAAIEPLLRSVRDALAPGGRFVFSEYTGPRRFQHDAAAREMVDRYFRLLPEHIRKDPDTGRPLWNRPPVDADRLARESPSEAAASDALLPLARKLFRPDAELSGGGGLLHPLLSGLARNFRPGSREDERLMGVLCAAEEKATALGILRTLFTVFVGRRPDGARMT
jgi:SAM-dependent methyltransferase